MSTCKGTFTGAVSLTAVFTFAPVYFASASFATPPGGDICLLPPASGDCQAAYLRYYYDPCTAQCLTFIYGGCAGNANNFLTLEECEAACLPDEDDVCSLPADVGPCDGVCPRFFHNICSGQCEPFVYGCCEGNANNFLTLEECEAACPPVTDVCDLPGVVGPCEAYIPSYYFNAVTAQCEPFVYGGCDGNGNRFDTLEECEATCLGAAPQDIPAVSEWGLAAMVLLTLTAGTLVIRVSRTASLP
jgi:hypothetical protein